MGFEFLLWLIVLFVNTGLIALNFNQLFVLSELEDDYLNSYEASSCISSLIILEYVLHGVFCILFLLTGNWIFFLVTVLPAYFNAIKFMKGQHFINVTEIVTVASAEKKVRWMKIGFYALLFVLVMIRIGTAGTFSFLISAFSNKNVDFRSSILEF